MPHSFQDVGWVLCLVSDKLKEEKVISLGSTGSTTQESLGFFSSQLQ